MYLNFSNFWGQTSAGGGGQALVQKRGQVSDGGGLAKFLPDGGDPPVPLQEKTLTPVEYASYWHHRSCFPYSLAIADVANSKCHQWLDEILIIFTRTLQKIRKVVCKKTMSDTHAFITSLYAICCTNRTALSFAGVLHYRVFWKQLCWFLWCSAGKKKKFKESFTTYFHWMLFLDFFVISLMPSSTLVMS